MTERPALTIDVAAARDIKTLSAALDDASTLVVRCTTERFKRVVTALLKAPRARLVDLSLIISDFDPGGEVGKPALTTKATDALWAALPALTRLVLRGHALCRGIAHPTLEHLDVEGYAFGAGAVPTQGACPRLRTLRWGFCGDEYGVALEPVALEALWSQSLPALRTLDLSGADIDGSLLSESSFLKAPLISQLTTLGLPSGTTDDWQAVLGALPGLAELRVASPSLAGRHPKVTVIEPPEDDGAAGAAGEAYELNNVNDAGLKKAKLITRAGPLRQLTVSYHSLQVEGARLLGQSAAAHPELEALNLNKPATRGWRKDALEAFAVALGTHPGLKALHLRKNQLDGAGGIISGLLARLPNLELLELSQTELDANDLREVIPAISRLPRLRTLLMGGLEATEASAVAWKVLSSATLQNLELWTSAFESGWSSVFHQMGRRLPALERLHVDGGHLPTAATAALADAFHGHQRLSALRIELAPTTGAYQMLGALMSSSPITHLVLEESSSRSDPGEARDSQAIGALRDAKTLTHLTIDIDRRDTAKHLALAEALATLPALHQLSGWRPEEKDEATLTRLADLLASSTARAYANLNRHASAALLARGVVHSLRIHGVDWLAEQLAGIEGPAKTATNWHTLSIVGGSIDKGVLKILLGIASANQGLKHLEILTGIKPAEGMDLAKKLAKLATIETLSLIEDEDVVQEIAAQVKGKLNVLSGTVPELDDD